MLDKYGEHLALICEKCNQPIRLEFDDIPKDHTLYIDRFGFARTKEGKKRYPSIHVACGCEYPLYQPVIVYHASNTIMITRKPEI